MLAIAATRESRRVAVLLGGSGLASRPPIAHRKPPMLLRSLPGSSKRTGHACGERHPSGLMTIDPHLRRIAATVMEMLRDDPFRLKEVIAHQRAAGAIAPDELVYLEHIADRWIALAEGNARRGASAHARESRG